MSKLKVLHVTFDMTIGGAQQVIKHLVEGMSKRDIESQVICIDGTVGDFGEMLVEQGCKVHTYKRQPGFDFQLVKTIRQLLKVESIDIVHCHQYTPYFYGLLATLGTGKSLIFTEHGRFYPDSSSWKRKLINPLFERMTNRITSISEATKQALVKFESFNPKLIEVIYNGIEDRETEINSSDALREKWGIASSELVLGTISRLQPIKNQSMMIRAFAKLLVDVPNAKLLIVGDGEIRSDLQALAKELQIDSQVIFTGFQKSPQGFHQIIDIFLLPSFSEGTSMTLLEAMSFSKPCVVTNVGGNPELIENEVNGYVVESDELQEFFEAILKLARNAELRRQFGQNGRRLFKEKFDSSLMLDNFGRLYNQLSI